MIRRKKSVGLAILGTSICFGFMAPLSASAQTTFGALSNFDVVNDTGGDCHGFEIELDGISSQDVTYTFGAPYERYGDPEIVNSPDSQGNPRVFVRYKSTWDPSTQRFVQATPVAPSPFTATDGHACYLGGPIGNYETSGCEHFGIGTLGNPTSTSYRWLKADPNQPGGLQAFGSNVSIPAPVWSVIPPAVPQQPPVIRAALPAVPPVVYEFGEAQWVKVFKTEAPEKAELQHLLTDDPNVPQEQAEVEIEWVLLQPSVNGGENELENEAPLGAGNESVTRRYEFYKYTGAYDPETHEAQPIMLPHDIPQADQIGDYIGAQMAAINVGQGLSVLDPTLPKGEVGSLYPSRPLVFGGSDPYTIEVTQGQIPQGMSLDLNSGIFFGTPTTAGQFSFGIHAVDASGAVKDGNFQIAITTPDLCPEDPAKDAPGMCGCGVPDTDTDGDGTPDCQDQCTLDATKIVGGICGCGVSDLDTDFDGTPDCQDQCVIDSSKIAPGICGCGTSDADSDGDGSADCVDSCAQDPLKLAPGICGCGAAETDSDQDGSPDCIDLCPADSQKVAPGVCGCGIPDVDANANGTVDCRETATQADLSIGLVPSSSRVRAGRDFEITLKARNLGPNPAASASARLTCSGVGFQFRELSRGCSRSGNVVSCSLGTIPNRGRRQKTVQLRAQARGVLECVASVSSTTSDPNPANQQSDLRIQVH